VHGDPRLAFKGGATIYQDDQRFEVDATLYAEVAAPASSFFGHYGGAVPEGVRTGPARIRFSDGTEADAALTAVDPDAGGFRIRGYLESSRSALRGS
jgi:hypothetical protein